MPSTDVPASFSSQLAACTGGFCVPDTFIKDPTAAPPSCKSLNNADGVCLSVCVPQVAQYESLLPQATCAADERCAPCINPLTMMSSGACDIGKSGGAMMPNGGTCTPSRDAGAVTSPAQGDAGPPQVAACPHVGAPVLDPSTLPSCDPAGGAHCLATALVPATMASQLAACPTGLCVPDVFIEAGGNFIPPTCASVNAAEGRCLDEMIPQVASQKATLPQATCAAYERCVPCYNPLDATATGACKLSCDPGPKSPPKEFTKCCKLDGAATDEGTCIPTAQVPASEQANLSVQECVKGASLCVPTEMLAMPFTPKACSATAFLTGAYTGVCLSKCLSFGFIQSLGIAQGDCDDIHECAPCTNPLTQQPTGAPGCPP